MSNDRGHMWVCAISYGCVDTLSPPPFLSLTRTRARWAWLCRCFTTSPSSPPPSSPSSPATRKPFNTTSRTLWTPPPSSSHPMVGRGSFRSWNDPWKLVFPNTPKKVFIDPRGEGCSRCCKCAKKVRLTLRGGKILIKWDISPPKDRHYLYLEYYCYITKVMICTLYHKLCILCKAFGAVCRWCK